MSWNRQSTTPMEYEYDNVHGPIDERSPFVTAVPNKKRKLNSFATKTVNGQNPNQGLIHGEPGPHSVFDSPSKGLPGAFNTPSRQQLRDPNSQPHFFSQAGQKPLPAVPSHVQNSSVWEPRTPASIIDFSSGGETPNTPAQDSEAATPDTQMANKMGRSMNLEGEGKKSPKKLSKRDSWLQKIFSSSPSPSKEERKPYSKKAENRIMKRRSKNRKLAIRDEYDSDDSIRNKNSQSVNAHGIERPGYATQAGNFFTWLEAHPHLPSVLSFWFQLLVNTILGGAFLYGLWTIWSGVQADIAVEAKKYEVEIMKEIAFCARQYSDNKCEPPTRVPAMEHACGNWHSCMQRNPKQVARASVSAKTFAMILNAFVEEFSYKSMVWIAFFTFLFLVSRIVQGWSNVWLERCTNRVYFHSHPPKTFTEVLALQNEAEIRQDPPLPSPSPPQMQLTYPNENPSNPQPQQAQNDLPGGFANPITE